MRHIKTYEKYSGEFMSNRKPDDKVYPVIVYYSNVPKELENRFRYDENKREFGESEILFHAKTKEELKIRVAARKYNL